MRLVWCLIGIRKWEYESTIQTKARKEQLELIGALKVLIAGDDSSISCAKTEECILLCGICGGLYPHSGARRICEGNQAEVDEA